MLDAWVHLNATWGPSDTQTANAALESRLEELWASQPEAAARCLELEPSEGSREAKLAEALSRYARAERQRCFVNSFTAQGLVRAEGMRGVAAEFDARCRGLAGRLAAAEAAAKARQCKQCKRRRLESSISSLGQPCHLLAGRVIELEVAASEKAAKLQAVQAEQSQLAARLGELCKQQAARVAKLEVTLSEKTAELLAVSEERDRLADRLGEAEAQLRAAPDEVAKQSEQGKQLEGRVLAAVQSVFARSAPLTVQSPCSCARPTSWDASLRMMWLPCSAARLGSWLSSTAS